MTNFQLAVEFLVNPRDGFAVEGGYVNDPKDPGGETKYGISKRSHPNVDIKNLTISDAMVIYEREYWTAHNLGGLSFPLCIVAFDSYVNHRPEVAKQLLEKSNNDWRTMIRLRREFYFRLIDKNPKMRRFKNGWLNRLNDLDKYCTILLENQKRVTTP